MEKKVYICKYCQKNFTKRQGKSKHELRHCKMNTIRNTSENQEITGGQPHENHQISALTELIKSQQLQISEMAKVINEIKDKPTVNQNVVLQQNNILCQFYFNEKSIDIYEQKKIKYGAARAMQYIDKILRNANSNNKFNWLADKDIIDKSSFVSPFKLTQGKKFEITIHVDDKTTIKDDGMQVNIIGNHIMTNSTLKAINDAIDKIPDFNQIDETLLDQLYQGPFGQSIYHNLDAYQNIKPTTAHLKSVTTSFKN